MRIMAADSWGYAGSINAQKWAEMAQFFGSRYAVLNAEAWAAAAVANERQVEIAGGLGYGHGVADYFAAKTVLPLPAPTESNGIWYLICARRDWAARETEFVALPGPGTPSTTPTEAPDELPPVGTADTQRKAQPGVLDDQPVWWAWVRQSTTTVELFDLRTFPVGDSIESIPGWISEALDAENIPTQIAAAVAAAPTVVAAAVAAVEDAMADADIVYGQIEKTPLAETEAEGGFVGENGRITDLVTDDEGALLQEVMERWGARLLPILSGLGLVSGSLISQWYGGGFAGENGRMTDLAVDDQGEIEREVMERWAPRIQELIAAGPDIVLPGDSLTAAGGIASRLATLSGRTVRNMGVGGETSTTIMARMGVWPFLISPAGMTIPASGSVDVTFVSSYHTPGGNAWPLLQGSGVREGDTYLWGTVAGIRVRLSIRVKDPAQDYPLHGAGDIYQITRAESGSAVTLDRPAPFIPEYGMARRGDIISAWIGQNGPSDDATFAAAQGIEAWANATGSRFLFMTAPGPVNTGWTDLEKRMQDRWGRRYMNVRRFLIDDALALMGLTPTSTDLADIAAGRVPAQLRTDAVHHTTAAQQAIAEWLVYPRMRELGYL